MRTAVLVSGAGSNLRALIEAVHGREVEIVAVACDREAAPALAIAGDAGIATGVFAKNAYEDRAARDAAMAAWLVQAGAELVVTAGYMALLDAAFVARFRDRIVNVHPSLLPAFPGPRPIQDALAAGARVTGVTVHLVDEGVDTGAIVLQRAIDLQPGLDAAQVRALLQPIEHELLPQAVRLLATGTLRRDPTDPGRLVVGG